MATLADYYIQIVPSAEGISGQLSSIMDSEAGNAGTTASSSFGSSFKTGLGNVAKVGAAAFGVFTAAAGAGTAALTSGIKGVAEYGDMIDKTSQKVGMTSDAFQQWDYVMNLAGTSMQECSMGMKTLTNKIDDAKNGSASALEMFEGLGISMEDLQSMSREDIWGATIKGMQNLEDSTERAALANDLFGKSGQNMTPLFNMTNEELNEAINNTEKYNMVLSEDAVKASAAFQDSLTTMSGAFSGLKNSLMADFLPGVTTIMDGLTEIFAGDSDKGIGMIKEGIDDFIDNLTNLVPQLSEIGGGILEALISAFSENSDALLSAGADVLIQLASALTENLPLILSSASEVILKLGSAFLDLAPQLLDTGLVILENLMNGIGENLDKIIPTVTSVILEMSSILISHIDEIVSAGLTIFMGLVQGLIQAIPLIIQQIPVLLNSLIVELTNSAGMIAEAGVTLLTALVENLPLIIDSICDAIPSIVDACVDFFTGDGMNQMMIAGYQLFVALITNLPQIITSIVGAVPKIISSLVTAFTNRFGELKTVGTNLLKATGEGLTAYAKNITTSISNMVKGWINAIKNTLSTWKSMGSELLSGLWNGISDKAQWVYDRISGMGSNIINKVKGIFGIASPSKVFAEIGEYLAEGLGIGWESEMQNVNRKIGEDINYKGNIELGTDFDDSALSRLDKVATVAGNRVAVASSNNNISLDGMKLTINETIDLGDTKLKSIVSDYTIRQIGSDLKAVKVSRGGVM